ncbi:MAG: hypothetical protein IJ629_04150 [Clostridia bacterium]|nr:hypothetical protein [Clostridia bacterium]
MMKVIRKLFNIVLIFAIMQITCMMFSNNYVFAIPRTTPVPVTDTGTGGGGGRSSSSGWDVSGELDKISQKAGEGGGRAGNTVTNVMGAAINIVSTVAAGVAIIMLVVLGIQYTSKGAEGKAEAKKDLTGYIIGAVLLFGTSGLLKLIQMFIDANLNNV